jgi:hypothetical protein
VASGSGGRRSQMSALKHGFFRRGFMLCDRCVLNGKCELLIPGGECEVERNAYDTIVSELKAQYGLQGLADEILVERVAMYLIRVARAEVYEAQVGVSSSLVAWGRYVAGLDNMLRVFLRELSLTRAAQKSLQRNDVVADVDELLNTVVKKKGVTPRIFRRRSAARLLVRDWKVEKRRLTVFRR